MGGDGSGRVLKTLVNRKGRICTKCGEFKEWKHYFNDGRGGKKASCKECQSAMQKVRRKSKGVPRSTSNSPYEINVHGRECAKCREFKPWINEYGEEVFTRDCGGAFKYRYRCKACDSNSGYYKFVNGFNRGRHLKRAVVNGSLLKGTEDEGTIFEFCIDKKRPTGERYKVVGTQFEKQELVRI